MNATRAIALLSVLSLAGACADTAAIPAGPAATTHQRALVSVPGDYATIQQGIDAATSGEVVSVAAGTWTEDLALRADVIVRGAGAATVIAGHLTATGITGAVLEDLTVGGAGLGGTGVAIVDSAVTLRRVTVEGFTTGVSVVRTNGVASAGTTVIDASTITGTGGTGLRVENLSGLTVTNTVVSYTLGHGIEAVLGAVPAANMSFVNNLLFACGYGLASGAGMRMDETVGFEIANSILVSNMNGLFCGAACDNHHNVVWGNVSNYAGAASAHATNMNKDPRFTEPTEGDFALLFDSPAVDAGDDSVAPANDAAGSLRPLGAATDIGPFEFLATPASVTIAINEVMANPTSEGTGEYVELYNFGASAVDVAGFVLDDGDAVDTLVAYQGGTTSIPAGGYAVILDPDYAGDYTIDGAAVLLTVASSATLGSGLSNGDPVRLFLADGATPIDSFSFPFNAGDGVSVEKDSIEDGDSAGNWVASPCGHTPGAANCASLPPNVSLEVLIAINEVMANPVDETTGEFVELYNFGFDAIELAGLYLNDGDATDALASYQGSATLLQPGKFAVILDPDYDGATYSIPAGTLLLTAASSTTLGNGLANNDPISLLDASGLVVIDTYTHTFDAGNGTSVEKVDPTIGDIASNFGASTCLGGASPGDVNCVTLDGTNPVSGATLAITEVMANPVDEDTGEYVELLNYGLEPIDLAGFRLSDGDTEEALQAFASGGVTVLQPGAFAVIVDAEYAGQYNIPAGVVLLRTPDTSVGSGLSTTDPITLRAPKGAAVLDSFLFPFNPGNGVSVEKIDLVIGDVPQNWIASPCNHSAGQLNCADGGIGGGAAPISTTAIVISEVMANPLVEGTGEYVELFNAGPVGVDVAGWWISDGDSLDAIQTWSGGTTVIAPGQFAVIFDADYANDYSPIPAGALWLTVGDQTLGNGLTTTDAVTLFEADGVTVVDAFSFPYNAGNGASVEKVTLTAGDSQDNWTTSPCRESAGDRVDTASPGGRNCSDPYGGINGTNALGQPCPYGAADCLSGLCAYELLSGDTFCTEDCSSSGTCAAGFTCIAIADANYTDVCEPIGGGAVPVVVINEVLYDNVGGDTEVFLELFGTPDTILDGLVLVGINGATGKKYTSLPVTGLIPADGYFVIAHPSATGAVAAAADQTSTKIDFQNGPDSIQLRYGDILVDAIGYGDFSGAVFAGEGGAAAAIGTPGESLARSSAGADSDDNSVDFAADAAPTPGAANN